MVVILLALVAALLIPAPAHAVPPPDFLFSIGSQVVQVFSFVLIGFSAVFAALRRFFVGHPILIRHGYIVWPIVIVATVVGSILLAGAYGSWQQKRDFEKWVALNSQSTANGGGSIDQLHLDEPAPTVVPPASTNTATEAGEQFIRTYYQNIADKKFDAAYAVSTKTVSAETFASWYAATTSLTVDSLQRITDNEYSLGITVKELSATTRYGVLMVLVKENDAYHIASSTVRILTDSDTTKVPPADSQAPAATDTYYAAHNQEALSISNSDFAALVRSGANVYVLDAREDEEYDIGRYPGSHHIRFADVQAGRWIEIPTDRPIVVFCWSGIRGKEVATFLREKHIAARYVEDGASGWVTNKGAWDGGIYFTKVYAAQRYSIVFTKSQVEKFVRQGAVLVDSRPAVAYEKFHIANSVSLPVLYTPTASLDAALANVPAGKSVITVCDDFVSCFDARVAGVKLEKAGHEFLGRYNKPWEFR